MNGFEEQETAVSLAFGSQSPRFDSITTSNPMEVLYREIVREHVLKYTRPGQRMLELNCGTGLDAVFFAGKGLRVHATDNSGGMLEQLKAKIKDHNNITYQKCSYNTLVLDPSETFDHVFSNFGGLNCTDDLAGVVRRFDPHLRSGGMAHLVLIAPVCLWEWATIFKGKYRFAFRRLRRHGVRSHLEGHYFTTYYYSPAFVKKTFGKNYDTVQLVSLGCLLPPTFNDYFPARYPRLFRLLKKTELRVNKLWPFNRAGDLFLLSVLKK